MQHDTVQRRSLMERIFHAVCFEGIATAVLAPTTAWLMQRSVLEMGGLTILLATTAMIWNIIYNALFDRLWPGEHRGVCAERQPASGIHAGNRFLPVLPAVYHVL